MTNSKPFSATLQRASSQRVKAPEKKAPVEAPRLIQTEEGVQLSWGGEQGLPLFEVLCKPSRSEALTPWVETLAQAYTQRRTQV